MKKNNKNNFFLKDMFICNFCRNICEGNCNEDLLRLKRGIIDEQNKGLLGHRKQIINCLGKYCDKPCKLQDPNGHETLDKQVLINGIMYLGSKLNEMAIKQSNEETDNG